MAEKDEGKTLIETRLEKEAEEAEAIRKAIYEPAPDDSDTSDKDKGDPPAGGDKDDKGDDTGDTPPADAVDPDAEKDADKIEETFKQKYLTLKGKYDKEVPKAQAALKTAQDELKQWQAYAGTLEKKVGALEEKLKEAAKAPEPKPGKTDKPKKIDLADPELSTLIADYPGVGKILEAFEAKSKTDEETIAALQAELKASGSKLDKIETDVGETRTSRFELDMIQAVGRDWRSTDSDPKFLEWLNAPVPYTGKTKLQLLQAASAALDAATVATFFNDYRATLKVDDAGGDDADDDNGADAGEDAAAGKLKKQVAPPRSGGTPPKKASAKAGTYTRAQYAQFNNELISGKFKPANWGGKTEAEMDAIFNRAIVNHELT